MSINDVGTVLHLKEQADDWLFEPGSLATYIYLWSQDSLFYPESQRSPIQEDIRNDVQVKWQRPSDGEWTRKVLLNQLAIHIRCSNCIW